MTFTQPDMKVSYVMTLNNCVEVDQTKNIAALLKNCTSKAIFKTFCHVCNILWQSFDKANNAQKDMLTLKVA